MGDGKVRLHIAEPWVESHVIGHVLVLNLHGCSFDFFCAFCDNFASVGFHTFFPEDAASEELLFDFQLIGELLLNFFLILIGLFIFDRKGVYERFIGF